MVVISDTTPLNYLVQLGSADILEKRFANVVVSTSVVVELQHPKAPQKVRDWVRKLPPWIDVREPARVLAMPELGRGECGSISLALELKAGLILMDDLAARDEALLRGLAVAGTIGLIAEAHRHGWIKFDEAIVKLRALNYRISTALIENVRRQL